MKKFLAGVLTGILLVLFGVAAYGWLTSRSAKSPTEIAFDQALTLIRNKEIKELTVRQDSLEIWMRDNEERIAKLDASDSTRDQIYAAAKETDTKINLEQSSSGVGWLILIQALPFLMLSFVVGSVVTGLFLPSKRG